MDMGWSSDVVESFRAVPGQGARQNTTGWSRSSGCRSSTPTAASPTSSDSCARWWRAHWSRASGLTSRLTARTPRRAHARPASTAGGLPYLPHRRLSRARSSRSRAPTASAASTQIRLLREWLEVKGYGVHRDRVDAVGADAADDRAGQGEQHAQQADLRPALRDRLRRPPREGDHPGAQGRASSSWRTATSSPRSRAPACAASIARGFATCTGSRSRRTWSST